MKFLYANRLFRPVASLGFLLAFIGCLAVRDPNQAAAYNGDLIVASETVLSWGELPSSILAEPVEIAGLEDFGAVLEDSVEMLRVDIEHRSFDFDWHLIGAKVAAKTALYTRPDISPPLLV